jgi:hypothetical protein
MSYPTPFTPRRARGAALAGLAVLAVFGSATPARAGDRVPAPRETSLVGAVDLKTVPGVRLHFAFDAHAVRGKEKEATGTFLIRHTEGVIDVWQTGTITCLQVGGPVAVASGTVADSNEPALIGRKAGFTVYDHGRRDRLNASWDMGFTGTPPPCMSTAPTGEIETGNFVVRG